MPVTSLTRCLCVWPTGRPGAYGQQIAMAGPVFAEDGESMIGSTFVIAFDTLNEARVWAAADPYARAGLFARVEIAPFKWLLGAGKPSDG